MLSSNLNRCHARMCKAQCRLKTSDALGESACAVAEIVERLVDGVEHGFDVLLHDAGLVVVDASNVVLDDVFVGGAEEGEAAIAHGVRVDDVVAIDVVGSGTDGVGTSNISGGVGNSGQASGDGATEPVRSEGLVAEDRAHSIGRELSGGSICEELEDESDFRERGEDTSDVELELRVVLLILVESVVLEFLEGLVVDNREFAVRSVITEASDVVDEGVEEVVLEVNRVTNVVVLTS